MNSTQTLETEARGGSCAPAHCSEWRRTTETFPPQDVEVEITHPNFIGTRTAKLSGLSGWYLTDCTHPAMNCYAPLEGSGWRMMPNVKLSDASEAFAPASG